MSLKTKTTQMKWNSGRLQITIGTAARATRSLELLVEEFQYIFTFWVAGENNKVEYTYGWYSASAGIKW
jgi:hypothetical protein